MTEQFPLYINERQTGKKHPIQEQQHFAYRMQYKLRSPEKKIGKNSLKVSIATRQVMPLIRASNNSPSLQLPEEYPSDTFPDDVTFDASSIVF